MREGGFGAARQLSAGNEHGERVALEPRADAELDVIEASLAQQSFEFGVGEAKPAIAETRLHPLLVMLAQIEQQKASAWLENARRFGQRPRRLRGVMQCL